MVLGQAYISCYYLEVLSLAIHFVSCFPGKQHEQSLLGNLQPLTPEVSEDVEDLQAVESMIIHGALRSGTI